MAGGSKEIKEVSPQESNLRLRKGKGIECDDAGDATAGSDARNCEVWVRSNMDKVADESRDRNEGDVTNPAEKTFHVVAEDEKEMHVADKVNDAGVKKE